MGVVRGHFSFRKMRKSQEQNFKFYIFFIYLFFYDGIKIFTSRGQVDLFLTYYYII